VYVAQPTQDSISVIDPATLTVTATYAVADCPTHLAASGQLLFYGYGCSGTGSLNHVDVGTGTVHPFDSPDVASFGPASGTPQLGAADGTLYATDQLGVFHAWPVTAGGIGVERTATLGFGGSLPFEVRGPTIAFLGDRVLLYDAATFTQKGSLGLEYYDVLGFSPDGTRVVAAGIASPLDVYDVQSGAQVGTVLLPVEPQNAWSTGSRAVFSPDGSLVYWWSDWFSNGSHYALVVASTSAPPRLSAKLTITPAAKYPGPTRFTITGTPSRKAVLYVQQNDAVTTTKFPVTLDAKGVAVVSAQRAFNGKAFVSMPGDATHSATQTAWVPFHVPVDMRVTLSKGYKTVNGVAFYAKPTYARQYVHLGPARSGRGVRATLWRWTGSTWVVVQAQKLALSSNGNAATVLVSAVRGVRYRVTFAWAGDRVTDAAKVTSPAFTIG
jgi:YVTN family beta-propeller protein